MPRPKKTAGAPKTQRKKPNEVKQATTSPAELSPEELAAAAARDQANETPAEHTPNGQDATVGEEQAQGEQDTGQAATDEPGAVVAPQEDTVSEEQAQGEQDTQQAATDEREAAVAPQEDTVSEEQAQGEQDAQQDVIDEQEGTDTAQGDAPAEEQAPALRVPDEPAVPISAEISKLVFDSGDTRAFANLRYGGLTVERLRVKQDASGLYVNMPKYKEDGLWKETCHFNSGQDRQVAENTVLSAYHQKLNEIQEQVQSESQEQAQAYGMGMEMQ